MIILMMKKGTFKKQDNKRKKEKCDNLGDDNENEQLRKYKKEGKKSYVVEFLMMKKGTFKKRTKKEKKKSVITSMIMKKNS